MPHEYISDLLEEIQTFVFQRRIRIKDLLGWAVGGQKWTACICYSYPFETPGKKHDKLGSRDQHHVIKDFGPSPIDHQQI